MHGPQLQHCSPMCRRGGSVTKPDRDLGQPGAGAAGPNSESRGNPDPGSCLLNPLAALQREPTHRKQWKTEIFDVMLCLLVSCIQITLFDKSVYPCLIVLRELPIFSRYELLNHMTSRPNPSSKIHQSLLCARLQGPGAGCTSRTSWPRLLLSAHVTSRRREQPVANSLRDAVKKIQIR